MLSENVLLYKTQECELSVKPREQIPSIVFSFLMYTFVSFHIFMSHSSLWYANYIAFCTFRHRWCILDLIK